MSTDRSFTPMEQKIASYWRETLNIQMIKKTDNFIELGGHSMLGMTLLNRLEEELGIRLRMEDLFQPLHRVASTCESLVAAQDGSASTLLGRGGSK